jgi:hypothetical protein
MNSTPARKINKKSHSSYRKKLLISCITPGGWVHKKLTKEQIMEYAHVSGVTAYRWMSGKTPIPKAQMELMQIKALGLMPDPEFRDYRMSDGCIIAPNGKSFPVRALEHFNMVYQQNSDLMREFERPRIEKVVDPVESSYIEYIR